MSVSVHRTCCVSSASPPEKVACWVVAASVAVSVWVALEGLGWSCSGVCGGDLRWMHKQENLQYLHHPPPLTSLLWVNPLFGMEVQVGTLFVCVWVGLQLSGMLSRFFCCFSPPLAAVSWWPCGLTGRNTLTQLALCFYSLQCFPSPPLCPLSLHHHSLFASSLTPLGLWLVQIHAHTPVSSFCVSPLDCFLLRFKISLAGPGIAVIALAQIVSPQFVNIFGCFFCCSFELAAYCC